MSTLAQARNGLREAARRPRLVAWLWAIDTAFAAMVALPLGLALDRLLAHAPSGDILLERYAFDLAADLRRAAPDLGSMLRFAGVAAGIAALVVAPYVAAGTVEVLRTVSGRGGAFRFARGAWLFGGRFLRAGLVAVPTAAVAAALAALPWLAVRQGLEESTAATARSALAWTAVACAALTALAALLALDLARLDIARRDGRRPMRLYFTALRRVLVHPLRVLCIWLWTLLPVGVALALYFTACGRLAATHWTGIALLLILQQLVGIARAATRVALWSAEGGLLDEIAPLPVPLPALPAAPLGYELEASSPS